MEGKGDFQLLATLLEWAGRSPLDSQELSRTLLNELGNLPSVFIDAPLLPDRFPQLGLDDRVLFRLYLDLMGRYLHTAADGIRRPHCLSQFYLLLLPHFYRQRQELVYVLFLDRDGLLLGGEAAAQGEGDTVLLPNQRLADQAVHRGAGSIVIAHNHPDGTQVFSHADLMSTLALVRQLASVGVRLIDHYLLADLQIFSLRRQLRLEGGDPWPEHGHRLR